MKTCIRMTGKEFISFCLMTVMSGIMIGLGGTSSLLANLYIESLGKLVGAVLFSFGIYVIVTYEMKLFTGMISDMPSMGVKNYWKLAVCFIGNTVGVLIVGLLVSATPLSTVATLGSKVIESKLMMDNWALSALCSSILCGVLITLSVKSPTFTKAKGLSASIGVIFPIIVFAFCGFDHSVANMLYLFHLGELNLQVIAYVLITIVGNVLGGVALPLVQKLKTTNPQD